MRIIQCDNCSKRYKAGDSNNGKATSTYKCSACGHLIVVDNMDATYGAHRSRSASPEPLSNDATNGLSITQLGAGADTEAAEPEMSLRTKFNLAICVVFLSAIVLIYFLAGARLENDAKKQVFEKAHLLLTTMEASRSFTSKVIKPALYKAIPGRFITEGMSSSFGARNIFERIRKDYPQYYFKHAAPHPRNPVNQADEFELGIIKKFSDNNELKEWRGYRANGDEKEYSIMKPIVAKDRCMRCHGDPGTAPPELLERYGDKNGFGRSVGEVIGTLTVSVPASVVVDKARKNTMVFIGMVVLFFGLLTLIVNLFFTRLVLQPIKRLATNADDISLGQLDTQINTSGGDEIAVLARAFNRMKISIKMAFEQLAR